MSIRTFKMLSFLLAYPEPELLKYYGDMLEVLKSEGIVSQKQLPKLEALVEELQNKDILDAQEEYVALFDRTPSLSLHLFEHIYGDSRERGQAMVDLQDLYMKEGLEIDVRETPDYLPMFLEYLSILPFEEAQQCLGEVVTILSVIKERLLKRKTPYVAVFEALEKISKEKPDIEQIKEALAGADGSLMTEDEMDAAWEAQPAFADMEGAGGACPLATGAVEEMLANIKKDNTDSKKEKAHG